MLIYVLRWRPFWISDRYKKQKLCRGPSNAHSWAVWFQLSKWFQRRSVLKHFSHRVQCEAKSCGSRHFEFHIGTKNVKFVEDHPMNIHLQDQRPIFFKTNSSIVAILELIRGAQCLIEVIRSSGEAM